MGIKQEFYEKLRKRSSLRQDTNYIKSKVLDSKILYNSLSKERFHRQIEEKLKLLGSKTQKIKIYNPNEEIEVQKKPVKTQIIPQEPERLEEKVETYTQKPEPVKKEEKRYLTFKEILKTPGTLRQRRLWQRLKEAKEKGEINYKEIKIGPGKPVRHEYEDTLRLWEVCLITGKEEKVVGHKKEKIKPKAEVPKEYLSLNQIIKIIASAPGAVDQYHLRERLIKGAKEKRFERKLKKIKGKQGHPPYLYEVNLELFRACLADNDSERARNIYSNWESRIEENEQAALENLLARTEKEDKIFVTLGELSLLPNENMLTLRHALEKLVKKNPETKREKPNKIGISKIYEYELTERLIEEVIKDPNNKQQILEALKGKSKDLETIAREIKDTEIKAEPLKEGALVPGLFKLSIGSASYVFRPVKKQRDYFAKGKHGKTGTGFISGARKPLYEIAAAIVDEELGIGVFPKTVIAAHKDLGTGSLRKYQELALFKENNLQREHLKNVNPEQPNNRKALRFICNAHDKHGKWGIDKNNRIIEVDHALTFGEGRYTLNEVDEIKYSRNLMQSLLNLDEKRLRQRLNELNLEGIKLEETQINAVMSRINKLKTHLRRLKPRK